MTTPRLLGTALATTLATLCTLPAGTAMAAGPSAPASLRIESETQFVRDYGTVAESVAPGVYQFTQGPFAGKTVAMGEAGLAYDLAALRAETPRTLRQRLQRKSRIRALEGVQARYRTQAVTASADVAKRTLFTVFSCTYWPINGKPITYQGYVDMWATTEYYLSDGGGGLNPYYARASAGGNLSLNPPAQVPYYSGSMSISARVENRQTGQVVQKAWVARPNGGTTTGYIGSGPSFGHDLTAKATTIGSGDCLGYASISDALQ